MTDRKKQTGVTLPDLTRQQLEAIKQTTGMNQTQIVVLAINRLYEQLGDITPKSQKPR